MQEQKISLIPGDIIQNRYVINNILGEGGFSTVYLVQDTLAPEMQTDDITSLFALKELRYQSHQEKVRFAFEAEILGKLNHPALPHFYRIFEDYERSQEFMLLEYIKGPNLEVLRRQQQHKRFTVSETLAIIKPIVEAISYLHNQCPPIMHRDIKPANIIVSAIEKGTVLVDFGIAKEYETDSTTTAIRHCSPGYGAPEQYSGYGTDTRTDIYGLGATCYALLTGTVPVDAFHRTTTLVSRKRDPLLPMNEIVPDVPIHIAQAIERAMSISQESRFSTVQDFWLALNASTTDHLSQNFVVNTSSSLNSSKDVHNQKSYQHSRTLVRHLQGKKTSFFILLCMAFLIIISGVLSFWSYGRQKYVNTPASPHHISSLHTTGSPDSTLPEVNAYPHIKYTYKGTIHDLLTDSSTDMFLVKISQSNERISGSFTDLHLSAPFVGVLDNSQHIFFTVKGDRSHNAVFFEGAVRSDGNLSGNYCNIDQTGQCTGNYGLWSVTPSLA